MYLGDWSKLLFWVVCISSGEKHIDKRKALLLLSRWSPCNGLDPCLHWEGSCSGQDPRVRPTPTAALVVAVVLAALAHLGI